MAEIRLSNLHKSHGDIEVLHNINLEVNDGEFLVLVGASGCGKSTILRLITGLEKPSSGEVYIGDKMVNEQKPKDRNIAMVFQSYALFPNMTVGGNLSFGMKVRGEEKDNINSEVQRIAKLLGLEKLLDRKPRELSGGQAQRVALGRAIIRKPGAFLFDEPLSNLDAELRVQMRSEIVSLQKKLGITTIYVTHDQSEAMTMGDRVAIMRQGEIIQVGTPLDLYDNPQDLFVAGFLGNPKINTCKVKDWEILNKITEQDKQIKDMDLTLAIRPEALVCKTTNNEPKEFSFTAKVSRWERLGHENILWLNVFANDQLPELIARIPISNSNEIKPGDEVFTSFSAKDVMLFETSSGKRINYNN